MMTRLSFGSLLLLVGSLAAVVTPAVGAAQPPPTSPAAADERELPARIERLVVRDTIEADGRSERAIEAIVSLRNSVGISQFGQIGMPYIEGYGEVSFESIVIEKLDGRRIEVRDAATEDLNPFGMTGFPLPADLRFRRLTVPGLEPGDRLSYRITSHQRALVPDVTFGEFKFAVGPLAALQVYELDAPQALRLSLRRRDELGVDWEDVPPPSGRRMRRLTLAKPIEMPEVSSAAAHDLVEPDVAFTTFRSWDEMARWWWKLSEGRFSPDDAVRAEAARITACRVDRLQRLEAMYAFVGGQIRYLNVGFGSGRYEPRPASEVLSTRYGDCKGKHALLAALGAAADIDVWPVLVHSSRKDLHDDIPSPAQFDHVISVVPAGDPSQWLWFDSTGDLAPAGYLTGNLRGKRALLVDETGGRVVTIPDEPPFTTRVVVETTGTLDEAGPLRARVRWTVRGDLEPGLRAAIRGLPREQWNELGKGLAKEWTKGAVSEVKAGDADDVREPFWLEYGVEHTMTSKTFEKDWDLWMPLPEMDLPEVGKPKDGEPAVELGGAQETLYRARVEVPEGMKARAPLSVTLDRTFASFRSTYAVEGPTLTVERVLQIRQRKISADQSSAYEAFRSAVKADRNQQFPIEAFRTAVAETLDTADSLNGAGFAALERGDPSAAADLLRRAVEIDPRHKWAWNNLGRALRKLNKPEEALKAFDRQIEINAYDLYAYDNRGATLLFDLNRPDEAEKDFLKQIEIAPLESYAYQDLARLRSSQERFAEAAELLERAASAKPSDKDVWLKLAWARARAGSDDTSDAVERALALDGRPRTSIVAARALAVSGDAAGAARTVLEKLPALLSSLDSDDRTRLEHDPGERELLYVAEAWRLIGASALQAGELSNAESYLVAAWELGATPDAAVDLGHLLVKQGRQEEALQVWQQASFLPAWRGNPAKRELERAVTDPAKLEALTSAASHEMAKRQVQSLSGTAPETAVEIRVRLLVDERGRILDVRPRMPQDSAKLEPLRDRVLAATLPSPNPDEATFKLVRGATVTCYPERGCSLGLNLYGDEVGSTLER